MKSKETKQREIIRSESQIMGIKEAERRCERGALPLSYIPTVRQFTGFLFRCFKRTFLRKPSFTDRFQDHRFLLRCLLQENHRLLRLRGRNGLTFRVPEDHFKNLITSGYSRNLPSRAASAALIGPQIARMNSINKSGKPMRI